MDIGLLGAMSRLDARIILEGDRLFEEFKRALAEQYVLQQLMVTPENDIFYWFADNASAELDFLIQTESEIIPLEVKATENLQAKSLKTFVQKFEMKKAIITSMSDFREPEWMVNMPLYNIGNLKRYLESRAD